MKRTHLLGIVLVAALSAVGCGDNSDVCGPGTIEQDGVCTVGSGSATTTCGPGTMAMNGVCVPMCTDGTILTPTGCMLDGSDCQDGTVLVGGACVDIGRVKVDVEEGAEPNGLGVFGEKSAAAAGTIVLNPIGSAAIVVHGHITPFRDLDGDGQIDPDVDSFVLHVDAPTAVQMSVDGVGGTEGGAVTLALNLTDPSSPLHSYQRDSINLTGDTSNRELVLPAAGDYDIAILDSRTLYLAGAAFGSAGAEYFASLTTVALPTPTPLTLTGGAGSATGMLANNALVAYTVPAGVGLSELSVSLTDQLAGALDILQGSAFVTDAEPILLQGAPADSIVAGFKLPTTMTVIVDPVFNVAHDPTPYELDVAEGVATPLSTDGGSASELVSATSGVFAGTPSTDLNVFFYDVGSDGDALEFHLAFNQPVDGFIVDQNFSEFLTFFTDENGSETFTNYDGPIRHLKHGRYYLLLDDPSGTIGATTLTATSTLSTFAPQPLATGSASGSVTNGTVGGSMFTYAIDAAANPWITFATPTNPGTVSFDGYDTATASGRLRPVTVNAGAGTEPPNALPVISRSGLKTTVSGPGHIEIDDTFSNLLLYVTGSNASPFTFEILKRKFTDLGTVTTNSQTAMPVGLTLNVGNFYLAHATKGQIVTFTVTPTGAGSKPHVVLTDLTADEGTLVSVETGPLSTAAIHASFLAESSWIAIEVAGETNLDSGTYDLSYVLSNKTVTYMAGSASAATFTSICSGPNVQTTFDFLGDFSQDEGLTEAISIPAFTYYGATVGQIQISTNGWFTFLPTTPPENGDPANVNTVLPHMGSGTPVAMVAPFWTDLANVSVCESQTATSVTVEWQGQHFDSPTNIDVQAKLDTTTGKIQFVYGSATNQQDTGGDATVGVDDYTGGSATEIEFDTAGTVAPSTSVTLTPM